VKTDREELGTFNEDKLAKKAMSPKQPPKLSEAPGTTWWRKEHNSAFNDNEPATTQMGAGALEQLPEFRPTNKRPTAETTPAGYGAVEGELEQLGRKGGGGTTFDSPESGARWPHRDWRALR
jgi:hypothetical protein